MSPERVLRPTLGASLSAKKGSDEASGLVRGMLLGVGLSGLEPLTSALSGMPGCRDGGGRPRTNVRDCPEL
jgi:hypothetical protein